MLFGGKLVKMIEKFELNPFEIKSEIAKIFNELEGVTDFENYEVHYHLLDSQSDKNVIVKLLFREINSQKLNAPLLKFLLLRYCSKKDLTEKLWSIIKNSISSNSAKIFALDFLRDIDSNWSYDECDRYLDNPDELIDADTKKILDNALVDPEVQIDFLDFVESLSDDDKIVLLKSLGNDYSKDELANMLIPVFLSMPESEVGKAALDLLGNSKSQLAYHALNSSLDFVDEKLIPTVKKNLSMLKLAGIREDNTLEYYKNLLKDSKPYKFCITYPDGHGNQAVIVSRINNEGKVRFVAIVIDDYVGIRDCFGFNNITKFECNTIIERFYRGQRALDLEPGVLKTLLLNAEKLAKYKMPYEYVCWRVLLSDVEALKIKLNYQLKQLSDKDFYNILTYDFTDYWFLNSSYSDEFEEFLKNIEDVETKNFDDFIDKNLEKVFYPDEYRVWTERILNCAVLKHYAGDDNAAQNLYSLYNDKKLIRELLKNILRKSIYEYYYAKEDTIRVKQIEDMWVK